MSNLNELIESEIIKNFINEEGLQDKIRGIFGGGKKEKAPEGEGPTETGEEEPEKPEFAFISDYVTSRDKQLLQTNRDKTVAFMQELAAALGMSLTQTDDLIKKSQRAADAEGAPGAGEEGEEDRGPFTPETPLSVMQKQKDLKTSEDGPAEQPVVGSLQQMGLSQKAAQMVAKAVSGYLKKRGLPVSESAILDAAKLVINEAKLSGDAAGQARSFQASVRRHLNTNLKNDPKAQKKYLYKVLDVAKRGQEGLSQLNANLASQLNPEVVDVVSQRLSSWANSALKSWGPGGFASSEKGSFRDVQGQKAENAKKLRDAAKTMDPLGKVIARSLSDNYGNAIKDKSLASLMADPKNIAKLSARIKKLLNRQLKRRGTDLSQVKNLMEMIQTLLESEISESTIEE